MRGICNGLQPCQSISSRACSPGRTEYSGRSCGCVSKTSIFTIIRVPQFVELSWMVSRCWTNINVRKAGQGCGVSQRSGASRPQARTLQETGYCTWRWSFGTANGSHPLQQSTAGWKQIDNSAAPTRAPETHPCPTQYALTTAGRRGCPIEIAVDHGRCDALLRRSIRLSLVNLSLLIYRVASSGDRSLH